jgi:hypothetical protein
MSTVDHPLPDAVPAPVPLRSVSIGVDPGPTPGVVAIHHGPPIRTQLFQCDASSVLWLVQALLQRSAADKLSINLQIERFVVGPRAHRSSAAEAGRQTRDMIGILAAVDRWTGVHVVQRSAAEVFPWASDARLSRIGLYVATKGMQHARAAARHALYTAVRDGGLTDPMSRDFRKVVTV